MARRKQMDEVESESSEGELDNFAPSAAELGPLADEVRSFLGRKEELAQKLAHEIETTEKKLAELKRTAAALFPEGLGNEPVERVERKPKKTKAIKLAVEEPITLEGPAPDAPAPEIPAPEATATEVAATDGPAPEAAEAPKLEVPAEPVTSEAPAPTGDSEPLAQVA
jgi:hypothetical protein